MQIKMKHFEMMLNENGLKKADIDYFKYVFYDINPVGRNLVSIQIGWLFYYLIQKEGKYQLLVNDFNQPSLELTDELDFSLTIRRDQLQFLNRYRMYEESSIFHQKIVCDKDILNGNAFYMERAWVDDESDSGWFIGFLDEKQEVEYEAIYAYELLQKKPSVVPFLMAPIGTLIVIEEDVIKSVVNENNEELIEHRLI